MIIMDAMLIELLLATNMRTSGVCKRSSAVIAPDKFAEHSRAWPCSE